ncbi:hypothetical protein BDY21DRAFT_339515 [Lineolata rhizophorae]|uniref:Uncharacterized protein n=1 Tax=Lineolata rhizophorae TaxID=578093 RepID=A0A6A6P545_9PEZI|nr:hypothetical protein BDY21DRAFT_339515 [Lineolata rhizophorae]
MKGQKKLESALLVTAQNNLQLPKRKKGIRTPTCMPLKSPGTRVHYKYRRSRPSFRNATKSQQ